MLAGEPGAIAPAVQAVWLVGGSVTMLHQPTARTDLGAWAEETVERAEVIGAEHAAARCALRRPRRGYAGRGIAFRRARPSSTATPPNIDADVAGEDDTALLQLDERVDRRAPRPCASPTATCNANIGAMVRAAARLDPGSDVMVSWLPLFHDMGMVGFLTIPMVSGSSWSA